MFQFDFGSIDGALNQGEHVVMVRKARILGFKSDLADFLDGFLKFKKSNVVREVNEGNIVTRFGEFKH